MKNSENKVLNTLNGKNFVENLLKEIFTCKENLVKQIVKLFNEVLLAK